jgi:hypothetical protein
MNEVFVNSRNAFLPAYDWGGALVWKYRDWTFSGIGMNVGENDDGDNIGIGYAYVDGGNLEHAHSQAVETYYRLAINDYLALTADVQYLKDDYLDPGADDVEGWILSMRAVVEF